jgi:leader peptidase (prepilin peptidase)/N-methyltransferase
MAPMWPLLAFLLGLAVGSFLNVVIHRLPKGETLGGRSRCPHCGRTLSPLDLLPVFSYLALGGRCRYCQGPISPRYPLVEGLTGGLFLLTALRFPPSLEALFTFLFLSFLVALAFIDLDTYELPDPLTYGLLLLGLVGAWAFRFPLPFQPEGANLGALDGALLSAGLMALIAGYGAFFLRRFGEGRPEVPVGPHQVHMAALLGALLGPGVGMALAFLSWALSARTGRPVVLPDRLTLLLFPLIPLAPLLLPPLGNLWGEGWEGLAALAALKGGLIAAGGLALAGGLYWAFRGDPGETEGEEEPVAMGYGDVKLMGALGAWLGPYALLALFLGVFSGALFGLLLRKRTLPFGPHLALGGVVAFFYGEALVRAYLAYLGVS